jgi:hypothetical protein
MTQHHCAWGWCTAAFVSVNVLEGCILKELQAKHQATGTGMMHFYGWVSSSCSVSMRMCGFLVCMGPPS